MPSPPSPPSPCPLQWSEKDDDNLGALAALDKKTSGTSKKQKVWSVNGYLGMPESWDHIVYTLFWMSLFPFVWYATTDPASIKATFNDTLASADVEVPAALDVDFATAIAAIVSHTPVPIAMLLSKLSGDKMSWRWPFQKESVAGSFGLFLLLGWAACIMPVYHATQWMLQTF